MAQRRTKMNRITPEEIKKYREEKGFTQDQLGDLLGVTQVSIDRWENGEVRPTGSAAMLLWIFTHGKEEIKKYKSCTNKKAGPWGALLGAGVTMVSGYALYLLLAEIFEPLMNEEKG